MIHVAPLLIDAAEAARMLGVAHISCSTRDAATPGNLGSPQKPFLAVPVLRLMVHAAAVAPDGRKRLACP
ncbi:hypothetical protein LCGC14_2403140 [marine sediment metagenome]|uniref:Uncharacterized protein n=1 Tax=marine sediment metagenome TaxID=412755 RepID=A0A0F9EP47_9ZZZZ